MCDAMLVNISKYLVVTALSLCSPQNIYDSIKVKLVELLNFAA